MKKHDRVNLASNIYKDRSRSRTSVSPSFATQSNTSFKSICCPSCKYLFRVPKVDTSTHNLIQTKYNKWSQVRNSIQNLSTSRQKISHITITKSINNIEVQTQPYLIGAYKKSPKRESLIANTEKRHIMTDRTPEKGFAKEIIFGDQCKTPMFSDRKYDEFSIISQRQSDMSRSRDNMTIKSISKRQDFPTRSIYLQGNSQLFQRNETLNKSISSRMRNSIKQPEVKTRNVYQQSKKKGKRSERDVEKQSAQLCHDLLKKIYLTEEIGEIIEYQLNLPPEIHIPSYCKMLVYDLNNQREAAFAQQDRNKQMLKDGTKMKQESYDGDLPHFKSKRKNEDSQSFNIY